METLGKCVENPMNEILATNFTIIERDLNIHIKKFKGHPLKGALQSL